MTPTQADTRRGCTRDRCAAIRLSIHMVRPERARASWYTGLSLRERQRVCPRRRLWRTGMDGPDRQPPVVVGVDFRLVPNALTLFDEDQPVGFPVFYKVALCRVRLPPFNSLLGRR